MELTELWNNLFDQVYVITLESNGRKKEVERELERVGLMQERLYFSVSIKTPLKSQFLNELMPNFWMQNRPNVAYAFDCSFQHYECWYRSKTLNHKRILVVEDDIRFLKDTERIKEILMKFPEDGNIVLFDKIHMDFCKYVSSDTYIRYNEDVRQNWSAACYAIDDKAISFLCSKQEEKLQPPDEIMVRYQNETDLNRYFVGYNMGIQGCKYNEYKWRTYYKPYYKLNPDDYED